VLSSKNGKRAVRASGSLARNDILPDVLAVGSIGADAPRIREPAAERGSQEPPPGRPGGKLG